MSEQTLADRGSNRSRTPKSDDFRTFIGSHWLDRQEEPVASAPFADAMQKRRDKLSAAFPGRTLVISAGDEKVRNNDCNYRFRAHSAFTHLTGWGSGTVPGAVLVMAPTEDGQGHDATLYFAPPAGRDTDEFYANPAVGEFWTGRRPSLDDIAGTLGITTKDIKELEHDLEAVEAPMKIANVDTTVDHILKTTTAADSKLEETASEQRLVKDDYAVGELQHAVDVTKAGFEDVIKQLPTAIGHARGERIVDGTFYFRARVEGNDLGYDTIAAAGPHACVLHWMRNDGPIAEQDLLLMDAGIELDSLYTADITRTLPVSGKFTPIQREVYEAVRKAADAAFAIVRPGIRFREVHAAAMAVIAEYVTSKGLLPLSLEDTLKPEFQYHRRYMVHGTSHHLGLDVHDCAQARAELYIDGILEPGMTFTIEPGLYFQPDDALVPEELRGIGVRIEDDVLVTEDGYRSLSADIPRTADDVEAWMRALR